MLVIILDFLKILYTWSSIACTSFFSTVYFVCKSINKCPGMVVIKCNYNSTIFMEDVAPVEGL